MSFLWHGLTEQGAQVPVQVDAQGRVVAVDGTPGVSNWERTGTTLSPAVAGDSVDIGSGNITLSASGSATFAGQSTFSGALSVYRDGADKAGFSVYNGTVGAPGNKREYYTNSSGVLAVGGIGGAGIDPTDISNTSRIVLDGTDGSATFAGNITAPNVTFRSADPQFYVKKSKNKDAEPVYVGPELDLLAEIARLEALVRHLYETLRITPPAGWPVWDGNDDVLRQLRK